MIVGERIGSYRIERKIGEGGMGTVYLATEVGLDRPVAIKVLNADLAGNPLIAERFRSEARAQAHLVHTHIAVLYTFLEHEGKAMMVMEYVEGETFQELVARRGAMPWAEIVPLFRQALDGVGAAHRVGLVHRDIKPANLMLNRHGVVKVMDFGIAKATGTDRSLTRTGVQVGTAYYMSPEQIKSGEVDARSDIYSLGITLYELLTGKVPFAANSEFQVLTDHVNTPPPLPRRIREDIPRGIENVVLKAIEKNPADRFQSTAEFGEALANPGAWENYASPLAARNVASEAPTAEISVAGFRNDAKTMPLVTPAPVMPAPVTPPPISAVTPPPVAATEPKKPFWTTSKIVVVTFCALALLGELRSIIRQLLPSRETQVQIQHVAPPPAVSPAPETPTAPRPSPFGAGKQTTAPDKSAKSDAATDATPAEPTAKETPPAALVIPGVISAQTLVRVRLTTEIDPTKAEEGAKFSAVVDHVISTDEKELIPVGSAALIRFAGYTKATRTHPIGRAQLQLAAITIGGKPYGVETIPVTVGSLVLKGKKGKFGGLGGAFGAFVGRNKGEKDPDATALPAGTLATFVLTGPVKIQGQ